MPELLLALLDEQGGSLLVESTDQDIAAEIGADLAEQLGEAEGLACARPRDMDLPARGAGPTIRISGIWHGSLIEGPGRRSVVRVQGCPIRCVGCYVPETHDFDAGTESSVCEVAKALLSEPHEGITILGGEPFAQPEALSWLVSQLRAREPDVHILVYSGYRFERLGRMGPDALHVLDNIDVLIDGPYVEALKDGAGPWTGSGNQRVIDMHATTYEGEVVEP
jgi:anaerobic ribonucleoside-triphosphate reductase activating protein